jgi:diketogulonate reductase-like aldo/keto reductase
MYENETAVGAAIAASGVKRERLFVAANSGPMPSTGHSKSTSASCGSTMSIST